LARYRTFGGSEFDGSPRPSAASSALTQESAIPVTDGTENVRGLAIREMLPDWDDRDCATLRSRPIFDEGIYGTVRFHHRSVRDFYGCTP